MRIERETPAGPFTLEWKKLSPSEQRSCSDLPVAAEHGAYGISILLVLTLTKLNSFERSVKSTGVDYWAGIDDETMPFNRAARLEVSGTNDGGDDVFKARKRAKQEQAQKSSNSQLPVFIVIVDFAKVRATFTEIP